VDETGTENAILRAAASIVTDTLTAKGHVLAAPVIARFRTESHGSTGVELTVKVQDPSRIRATMAVIAERFGGDSGVDVVRVA